MGGGWPEGCEKNNVRAQLNGGKSRYLEGGNEIGNVNNRPISLSCAIFSSPVVRVHAVLPSVFNPALANVQER